MVMTQPDIHMKKMNLATDFTPFMKTNSEWIVDLQLKCTTTELLEDNIEEKVSVLEGRWQLLKYNTI